MWRILQQKTPEDFVLATGKLHSVREFCELSFRHLGIEIGWKGEGVNEKGYDKKTNKILIEVDPYYFRPTEVDLLLGDPSKAKEKLGWHPSYTFEELVKEMVESDLKVMNQ